ncbi:MAG: head-tail connector protein [Sphaerochaetaceae bacterium]|jgi:uncharacterized phage protein (predicted DNA packaging)
MADTASSAADILSACRTSLRITATDYDDEISTLISAAKADLKRGGITSDKAASDSDPLVRVAIISYVKASFGLDNDEADRYAKVYQSMLSAMKCSSDYGQSLTVAQDG